MSLWNNSYKSEEEVNKLINEKCLPRPIALSLIGRGIGVDSVDDFFSMQLKSLVDPFQLPGVEVASKRIWKAILNQEHILIYGDYDTDGVTATTLLYKILLQAQANVSWFLPHRFDDGYGFTVESLIKVLDDSDTSLVITVDCGTSGVEAVDLANSRGVDVIITDHHESTGEIPKALAVINPKLHKEIKEFSVLAGVGVAFKLAHGFLKYGRHHKLGGDGIDLKSVLDLLALGTVADIVPLLGENRILVNHGLKLLGKQLRPGVRALCESVNLNSSLRPSHISFNLAPKINAAGRFGSPGEAFDLLNTDNIVHAYSVADALNNYNILRKETENKIYNNAIEQLEQNPNRRKEAVMVAGEGWHLGVVGIVASRLTREFNLPAIVLSIDGDIASGSGRSVGTINLVELLRGSSEFLTQFGGHPMASGLTLERNNIEQFFNKFADTMVAKGIEPHVHQLDIDGVVTISELEASFFNYLEKLEPFGCGNPEPLYQINGLTPINVLPATPKHSRGQVMDIEHNSMDFIAFNIEVNSLPQSEKWDIVVSPQINEFRGRKKFQLQIKDIRASEY